MRKTDAYLTVEAALVLPIVLSVVLFVIYLLFFQYDRCLMDHNTGLLAMRGCTLQLTDVKKRVTVLMEQSKEEDERYLVWNMEEAKIRIQGNYVQVERSGSLKFPFRGLGFWKSETTWESSAIYKNYRITPVDFIRNYRKVKEKME